MSFYTDTLPLCQPDFALMAVTCVCLARHGLAVLWLLLVNEPVQLVFFSAMINNGWLIHLLLNRMRRLFLCQSSPSSGCCSGFA